MYIGVQEEDAEGLWIRAESGLNNKTLVSNFKKKKRNHIKIVHLESEQLLF